MRGVMDFDVFFSIGELAKICGVTPKTLRFYDKLGLLKPALINPQNGYRFYNHWHITRVATIKQLQEIGFSLDGIHAFLETDECADIIELLSKMLDEQQVSLQREIENLTSKLAAAQSLQSQCAKIKDRVRYDDKTGLIFREIPRREILYMPLYGDFSPAQFQKSYQEIIAVAKKLSSKDEDFVLASSPLAIYDSCPNLKRGNIRIGYELQSPSPLPFAKAIIESGLFACYTFRGSYSKLRTTVYQEMHRGIAERGYFCSNQHIEYYYLNETVAYENNYLTEIQILINVTEI